jgi:hypothetical protein
MKKLTKREAALVRNARKKAVEDYEQNHRIVVRAGGFVLHDTTLHTLRCYQNLGMVAEHSPANVQFEVELKEQPQSVHRCD